MYKNLDYQLLSDSKEWLRFTTQLSDTNMNFRILSLPESLLEKAIDFIMDYYVAREVFHRNCGMTSSREAMDDYRRVLTKLLKNPLYQTVICCLDNGSDASRTIIVGISLTKIISKNDVYDEIVEPKSKTVIEFFEKLHLWNNIFSVTNLMKEYGLDYMQDDRGLAVHPDYERYGIARKLIQVRLIICKGLGIPMSGAWLTTYATQKLAEQDGWIKVFEIKSEELGLRLGIPITDAPPTITYVIFKIPVHKNKL